MIEMLKTRKADYYQVRSGQTLEQIAAYFSLSPFLLARENRLTEDPFVGQILRIPKETGNAYVVREGDTKKLLCGSDGAFERKNGTSVFYIGMRIIL